MPLPCSLRVADPSQQGCGVKSPGDSPRRRLLGAIIPNSLVRLIDTSF